jgi:glycosyltransferase involved in cell wall biosynthesis
VIIPSFCETFGLTAIEAMLRGIPIVTSPIPAFLEWVPPQMIADALTPAAFAQKIHDVQVLGRDSMLDLYANCLARFSESSFVTVLAAQLGITSATDA